MIDELFPGLYAGDTHGIIQNLIAITITATVAIFIVIRAALFIAFFIFVCPGLPDFTPTHDGHLSSNRIFFRLGNVVLSSLFCIQGRKIFNLQLSMREKYKT